MDSSPIQRNIFAGLTTLVLLLTGVAVADDTESGAGTDAHIEVRATWATTTGNAGDESRARDEAVGRALLQALTRWMTVADLKQEYKLVRNSFLVAPMQFVSDLRSGEVTKKGRVSHRFLGVLPNYTALESELLRIGLLMLWRQSPRIRVIPLVREGRDRYRLDAVENAALRTLWANLNELDVLTHASPFGITEASEIQRAIAESRTEDIWPSAAEKLTMPTDYVAFVVAEPASRTPEVAPFLPPSSGDVEVRLYRKSPWTELLLRELPRFSSPFETGEGLIRGLENAVTGRLLMEITARVADDWLAASKKYRYAIRVEGVPSVRDALGWFRTLAEQRTVFHQVHPSDIGPGEGDEGVYLELGFYSLAKAEELLTAIRAIAEHRHFKVIQDSEHKFLIQRGESS